MSSTQKPADKQTQKADKPIISVVTGDQLIPDLDSSASKVIDTRKFWCGVIPECPYDYVHVAGVTFQKFSVRMSKSGAANMNRQPQIGRIEDITRGQFETLIARIPYRVFRFGDGNPNIDRTAVELGDDVPKRSATIQVIHTDEDNVTRKANGFLPKHYRRAAGDVPFAKLLFCIPCNDQQRGELGAVYPETMDVTGLVWPE